MKNHFNQKYTQNNFQKIFNNFTFNNIFLNPTKDTVDVAIYLHFG